MEIVCPTAGREESASASGLQVCGPSTFLPFQLLNLSTKKVRIHHMPMKWHSPTVVVYSGANGIHFTPAESSSLSETLKVWHLGDPKAISNE